VRPTWIEVDLDAVSANVAAIAAAVAPAALCAVVKADGYGHGDVPVAEAALASGARWLAVALLEEGVRLREAGIEAPILLLSEVDPADVGELDAWGLTPTAYTARSVAALASTAPDNGVARDVHLKVDTGMHRVGADPGDVPALADAVAAAPGLTLAAVWTHFAVAEEDPEFTGVQIRRLEETLATLAAAGHRPRLVHAANTAGALGRDDARYDLVRCGLGIYGMRPHPAVAPDLELRPAMRVVSHVTMVRRLAAGERPSYGRRRPLPVAATVATVPIGYADGVPRRLSALDGEVLIGGRRHPLAGTVTMDQIVVDVGDAPVEPGDEVVLLGEQGGDRITAEDWATRLDTINYEVVCRFGPRLPRTYSTGVGRGRR
jgi:alanine racemase